MNLKTILTVTLMIIFSGTITAQEDGIMDALKKAAGEYNEKMDEEDTQNGENPDNNNSELSDGEKESLEQWKKIFDENKDAFKKGMDHFDTKETSCIFLMVLYLDSYFSLVDKIEETNHCQTKYDLYGLQAIAITSSTTIMYCPESLFNMTVDEREEVYNNDLVPVLMNVDNDPFVEAWKQKLRRVTATDLPVNEQSPYGGDMIYRLCSFFSPGYILPALLTINQQMEALGCGD